MGPGVLPRRAAPRRPTVPVAAVFRTSSTPSAVSERWRAIVTEGIVSAQRAVPSCLTVNYETEESGD